MPTESVSGESSSWFTGSRHLAECSSDLFSVLIREGRREREREGEKESYSLMSLPIRTQILWDQGPTHMTSFNLPYLLIGPVSK